MVRGAQEPFLTHWIPQVSVFGAFWAAYIRRWWLVAIYVAGTLASLLLNPDGLTPIDVGILVLGLVSAFRGEGWEVAHLEGLGYKHIADVRGSNTKHALSVFLARFEDDGWTR